MELSDYAAALREANRRYATQLIRRALGKCEQCGRIKRFRHRACDVCVPSV